MSRFVQLPTSNRTSLCPTAVVGVISMNSNFMIKNFLSATKQLQEGSHGGVGKVELYEIWSQADFKSNMDFFDRVVVPPNSTIGYHQHGENEEMYIILEGEGTMTIDDKTVVIRKGDMILNPKGGKHGLRNNSGSNIDILIVQIAVGN